MAFSTLVTMGAGAATSAVGSYWSAKSTKSQLEGQAKLAEISAQISESGAQSALLQGQQEVASATLRAGQLKSSQRASMAANGIDLGEGSAAETVASTDIMKEIDKNTIEANAVKSAWGYRTQAVNQRNEALMRRATADGINPMASAAVSLLGSATSVASTYYGLKKAGAFEPQK